MADKAFEVPGMNINNDDLITDLMIKYARREQLTPEEMALLEEWARESPENQQLIAAFGDPVWVRAELAKLKSAPMRQIWREINGYLDEIGAPDDRVVKEWQDKENPVPLRLRLYVILRRWWRMLSFRTAAK